MAGGDVAASDYAATGGNAAREKTTDGWVHAEAFENGCLEERKGFCFFHSDWITQSVFLMRLIYLLS